MSVIRRFQQRRVGLRLPQPASVPVAGPDQTTPTEPPVKALPSVPQENPFYWPEFGNWAKMAYTRDPQAILGFLHQFGLVNRRPPKLLRRLKATLMEIRPPAPLLASLLQALADLKACDETILLFAAQEFLKGEALQGLEDAQLAWVLALFAQAQLGIPRLEDQLLAQLQGRTWEPYWMRALVLSSCARLGRSSPILEDLAQRCSRESAQSAWELSHFLYYLGHVRKGPLPEQMDPQLIKLMCPRQLLIGALAFHRRGAQFVDYNLMDYRIPQFRTHHLIIFQLLAAQSARVPTDWTRALIASLPRLAPRLHVCDWWLLFQGLKPVLPSSPFARDTFKQVLEDLHYELRDYQRQEMGAVLGG